MGFRTIVPLALTSPFKLSSVADHGAFLCHCFCVYVYKAEKKMVLRVIQVGIRYEKFL